jgi:hypothetical protein
VLSPTSGDTITVKTTGNIVLASASERVLKDVRDQLVMRCDGTNWEEISLTKPFVNYAGWVDHDVTGTHPSLIITPLSSLIQLSGTGYSNNDNADTITAGVDGDVVIIKRFVGRTIDFVAGGNLQVQSGGQESLAFDARLISFVYHAASATWIHIHDVTA